MLYAYNRYIFQSPPLPLPCINDAKNDTQSWARVNHIMNIKRPTRSPSIHLLCSSQELRHLDLDRATVGLRGHIPQPQDGLTPECFFLCRPAKTHLQKWRGCWTLSPWKNLKCLLEPSQYLNLPGIHVYMKYRVLRYPSPPIHSPNLKLHNMIKHIVGK